MAIKSLSMDYVVTMNFFIGFQPTKNLLGTVGIRVLTVFTVTAQICPIKDMCHVIILPDRI